MKSSTAFLITLLCAPALPVSAQTTQPVELKFTWVDPADPAIASIRRTGDYAILYATNKFMFEVNNVLSSKGAEEGIGIVHLKGVEMPRALRGQPVVTAIKLTSLKLRDSANAPDNADEAALESIRADLLRGRRPPNVLVQHVEAGAGEPEEWRFYRPIGTTSACLQCHGASKSLSPGVKEKLHRLFPDDKALDYSERDWRGVIRVSVTGVPVAKS